MQSRSSDIIALDPGRSSLDVAHQSSDSDSATEWQIPVVTDTGIHSLQRYDPAPHYLSQLHDVLMSKINAGQKGITDRDSSLSKETGRWRHKRLKL